METVSFYLLYNGTMQKVILSLLLLYSTVFRIAHAEDAVNEAVSLPYPAMIGLLVANPKPLMIDAGSMGDIYIDGVISGVGLFQNNPEQSLGDLSNAQLFIQKKEGNTILPPRRWILPSFTGYLLSANAKYYR